MDIHILITIFEILITFLAAFAASSGFWMYLDKKRSNSSNNHRLLLGLAHDRIVYLCLKFIGRGWITQDEYENLYAFLYQPYTEMNGNGSVKRLMAEVDKLPILQKTMSEMKEWSKNDTDE